MAGHPFVQYNAGLGRVGGVMGETVETNRGQCWGAGVVLVAVLVANCGGQSESKGSDTTDDGKWGGLPIPASCTPIYEDQTDGDCQLDVECAEGRAHTICVVERDGIECNCSSRDIWYRVEGVELSDACAHGLALCFERPKLETTPFECTPRQETHEPSECVAVADCTREGTVGRASFTELQPRRATCVAEGSGWRCLCERPTDASFELPASTGDSQCLDARAWCAGEDLELVGGQTCTTKVQPPAEDEDGSTCFADIECERQVLLSGQAVTMHEATWVACNPRLGGGYDCQCLEDSDSTEVDAMDAASACTLAGAACRPRNFDP